MLSRTQSSKAAATINPGEQSSHPGPEAIGSSRRRNFDERSSFNLPVSGYPGYGFVRLDDAVPQHRKIEPQRHCLVAFFK